MWSIATDKIDFESAETASAEATTLHPTLIGKVRVLQFRIR
jgi:hypothetical protein